MSEARKPSFGLGLFVAILVVLAATGLVPSVDFVAAALASLYIYLMSLYAYPPVTPSCPQSVFAGNKLLKRYVLLAAFVGVFAPLAYILLGVFQGHKLLVKAAARHTFLLVCQILSEQATSRSNAISILARALVPILYNAARLAWIWSWMQDELLGSAAPLQWVVWGRVLAVSNMALWSYNLFGFLLPMYLPRCLRKYYEDEQILKGTGKASND